MCPNPPIAPITGRLLIGLFVGLAVALSSAAQAGAQSSCGADCDGDASVGIHELIIAVNVALGREPMAVCPDLDRDVDGSVTIDELVQAVDEALTVCPGAALLEGVDAVTAATRVGVTTVHAFHVLSFGSLFANGGSGAGAGAARWQLARATALQPGSSGDGQGGGAGGVLERCQRGGTKTIECVVAGGVSVRTVDYNECRDAVPDTTNTILRDGEVVERVTDAQFCQTLDPAGAAVTQEFEGYSETTFDSASRQLVRRRLDLVDEFVPEGDSCAGETGTQTMDGTVRFDCDPAVAGEICNEAIRDIAFRMRALRLRRQAVEEPCTLQIQSSGQLTVDNFSTLERFSQALNDLVIAEFGGQGEDDPIAIEGRSTVDCLGAVQFTTPDRGERLQLRSSMACPGVGLLEIALPMEIAGVGGASLAAEVETAAVPDPRAAAVVSSAGFRESAFRAADGSVYQVLQNRGGDAAIGAEDFRITTLVGSLDAVGGCATSPGLQFNAEAVSATASGLAFPTAEVVVSDRIPDASLPCFNPNGAGGAGTVCVGSGCSLDCECPDESCTVFSAGAGSPLAAGAGAVPPGVLFDPMAGIGNDFCRSSALGRAAYGFGPGGPTTAAAVCSALPPDGFTLPGDDSTVIVAYLTPLTLAFDLGSGGFAIDRDGRNLAGCTGTNRVIEGLAINRSRIPAPRARFTGSAGVEFDFNGDARVDKALASCLDTRVRCTGATVAAPTPTPGVAPPCPQFRNLAGDSVERSGDTTIQPNRQGGATWGTGGTVRRNRPSSIAPRATATT